MGSLLAFSFPSFLFWFSAPYFDVAFHKLPYRSPPRYFSHMRVSHVAGQMRGGCTPSAGPWPGHVVLLPFSCKIGLTQDKKRRVICSNPNPVSCDNDNGMLLRSGYRDDEL